MHPTHTSTETEPLLNSISTPSPKPLLSKWYIAGAFLLFVTSLATFYLVVNPSLPSLFSSLFSSNSQEKMDRDWVQLETVSRSHQSPDWTQGDECSDDTFTLLIALKQQNTDKLHSMLMEVSDPKSPKYGEFYTMDEVNTLFAPLQDSIDAVNAWLSEYNLEGKFETPNGDFISARVTCQIANEMLNTRYSVWQNQDTKQAHFRLTEGEDYFIPKELENHIELVSPTLRFPPKSHITARSVLSSLDEIESESDSDFSNVSPDVLYKLYSMSDYIDDAVGDDINKQAIGSWLDEYYEDDDLETFQTTYNIDSNTFERVPSTQEQGYGAEAELDAQYIGTTGVNIYTQVYYTDNDSGHWILAFLNTLRNSDDRPNVVSMSYGANERGSGIVLCKRANRQFGQLSLTGMTFFASSGDSGARGDVTVKCTKVGYQPSFPATCTYVTAVGGVHGGSYADVTENTNEITWLYSGGGFSTFWERPSWQHAAVTTYLSTVTDLPDASLYSSNGRGMPDISAQSVSYIIRYESGWYTVSGTSCSSPAVAGMFALINDLRLQAGKSTLGFLNPALYSLFDQDSDSYFNDVASGYNKGCKKDDYVGFMSYSGWDPASGVGTPKFSQIAQALLDN